jgi:hypothetical protein
LNDVQEPFFEQRRGIFISGLPACLGWPGWHSLFSRQVKLKIRFSELFSFGIDVQFVPHSPVADAQGSPQ